MISYEIINITIMIIKLSFFYGYNRKDGNLKNTSMKFNISGGSELERPIDFNLIIYQSCFY